MARSIVSIARSVAIGTSKSNFCRAKKAGLSILRSSPNLRGLEIEPNAVLAELETDDEGLADLIDEFTKAGVRFKSFNDRDPTLEDVFMSVTKGLVT